jgi:hypothetical protein
MCFEMPTWEGGLLVACFENKDWDYVKEKCTLK